MATNANISYANTLYSSASSSKIDIKELNIIEDWDGRPASDWSLQKIGALQSKIESFTSRIYHSNRYGKHNLTKVIPNHVLKQFANEAFGYDGWKMEVMEVEATECLQVPISQSSLQLNKLQHEETPKDQDFNYMVIAEAEVRITLKDGTNTKRSGVGKATMPSKGNCFSKAKKEAVSDALKKCLLGFEQIINDYNTKVKQNYFVDGLYVSKVKTETSNTIPVNHSESNNHHTI